VRKEEREAVEGGGRREGWVTVEEGGGGWRVEGEEKGGLWRRVEREEGEAVRGWVEWWRRGGQEVRKKLTSLAKVLRLFLEVLLSFLFLFFFWHGRFPEARGSETRGRRKNIF
jgi:hypothetical protein